MDYRTKLKNKIPVLAAICLILLLGILCSLEDCGQKAADIRSDCSTAAEWTG